MLSPRDPQLIVSSMMLVSIILTIMVAKYNVALEMNRMEQLRWSDVLNDATTVFDVLDSDLDDSVSTEARDAFFEDRSLQLFDWSLGTMDSNHDGLVSRRDWNSWFTQSGRTLQLAFQLADKNHDHFITILELQEGLMRIPFKSDTSDINRALNALITLIDKDHNGLIDLDSWKSAAGSDSAVAELTFNLMDVNKDGVVNLDELKAFLIIGYSAAEGKSANAIIDAKFKQADADHNGQLTLRELEEWLNTSDSETLRRLFAEFCGVDGHLDKEEFRQLYMKMVRPGVKKIFNLFDANLDGFIDKDEFVDVALPLLP